MATQSGKIVLSLEPVRRLVPAPPPLRRSPGDTLSAESSQVYSCNGSRSALQRTLGNQASRSILADGCSTLAAVPALEVRAQRDFLWRMRTLTLRQSIGNRALARLLARTPPSSSPKDVRTIQRVHLDNIGQKAFDCPDYAGDKKLEACLNDTDRLAPGDSGPTVALVQNGLLRDGADLGPDGVDGKYGPATGMAVKAFKTKYRLGFEQFPDVGPGTMAKLDELCRGPGPPPPPAAPCPDSTQNFPNDPSTILGLKRGDGVVTDGNPTPDEIVQRPRVHRLQELLNQHLPGAALDENCSFDDPTEAHLIGFQNSMDGVFASAPSEGASGNDLIGAPPIGNRSEIRGQVDLPTAKALLAKAPPPPRPACPRRDSDETNKSFFSTPTVNFSASSSELLIQGFPVSSSNVAGDVPGTADWQKAISFMAGDPNTKIAIAGFTDCAGSDAENFNFQQKRADAIKALMPPQVQSRVIAAIPAGTAVFLAGNATAAERSLNRAVRVKFQSQVPPGEGPFDRLVRGAKTLDEYLFLVRSLEQRLGLSAASDAPKALSVLRQIYFGTASWTKASGRTSLWNLLISNTPWSPGDDPTAQLTTPLMQALQNSQDVEGTDIGHVLAGIDAMMNPHQVAVRGIQTGLINEEVANWSGDVGSAAAERAVDLFYGRTVPKSANRPVGSADDYFKAFAGPSDLIGDIDAFAMRAGFSPNFTGVAADDPHQADRPPIGSSASVPPHFPITAGASPQSTL